MINCIYGLALAAYFASPDLGPKDEPLLRIRNNDERAARAVARLLRLCDEIKKGAPQIKEAIKRRQEVEEWYRKNRKK